MVAGLHSLQVDLCPLGVGGRRGELAGVDHLAVEQDVVRVGVGAPPQVRRDGELPVAVPVVVGHDRCAGCRSVHHDRCRARLGDALAVDELGGVLVGAVRLALEAHPRGLRHALRRLEHAGLDQFAVLEQAEHRAGHTPPEVHHDVVGAVVQPVGPPAGVGQRATSGYRVVFVAGDEQHRAGLGRDEAVVVGRRGDDLGFLPVAGDPEVGEHDVAGCRHIDPVDGHRHGPHAALGVIGGDREFEGLVHRDHARGHPADHRRRLVGVGRADVRDRRYGWLAHPGADEVRRVRGLVVGGVLIGDRQAILRVVHQGGDARVGDVRRRVDADAGAVLQPHRELLAPVAEQVGLDHGVALGGVVGRRALEALDLDLFLRRRIPRGDRRHARHGVFVVVVIGDLAHDVAVPPRDEVRRGDVGGQHLTG